ncbi:GLABROUS1 enhancer-binding protein-like 2 isoform X2 [Arabidopsis lyrata subsp. lyrata]|nr:GLABROUS1 enhancer-binding protein-like 2 isoform X2 [Arabidopsis lyrata subsp. lyrata]|eukprot:XP_020876220.1 GLABROUS1 enhancer-binding protein-like 2 isoform X2 [Arabidopsis lyrata subsp. lyrata]
MATPTELDFSSPGGAGDDNTPRKRTSKRTASETVTAEETKKKNKLASPMSNRIWNEEDELSILKGLLDFRAKTGLESKIDWEAFYCFVRGSIHVQVSKDQVLNKTKKLKKKFLNHMEKINRGIDPHFTRSIDSEAFGFSMMIWGKNDAEYTNGATDKTYQNKSDEEMFKKDEEVALIDNGAGKSDFDGKSPPLKAVVVDKITTKNGTAGKEGDDVLCAVRDAFETTMVSQGLSDYQKKLQLEKLMNLGTGKKRELSNEWKALCVEELKLNIKKLRFSAKLAEAANDDDK